MTNNYQRLIEEIEEEKASALKRVAEKFEFYIEKYREISNSQEKVRTERLKEIEKKVALHFWYLIVQRESYGIKDHSILYTLYPELKTIKPVK